MSAITRLCESLYHTIKSINLALQLLDFSLAKSWHRAVPVTIVVISWFFLRDIWFFHVRSPQFTDFLIESFDELFTSDDSSTSEIILIEDSL
jgi:hypothetical protein